MKNKSSLVLIEMSAMLLIFAAAVTVCLKTFAWSHKTSELDKNRTEALILLQNTAELIKHCGGELSLIDEKLGGGFDGEKYSVYYGEAWNETEKTFRFYMDITPIDTENELLGGYLVEITGRKEGVLASSEVYYQEDGK